MSRTSHLHPADLRGLSQLAFDATQGVTSLVEEMHRNIAATPGLLGRAPPPTKGLTGAVYGIVRGVTGLLGRGADLALGGVTPLLAARSSTPEREAVIAACNGVIGDYLVATHNPLAIPMRLRRDGQPLTLQPAALAAALPEASGHILLLIHGLCMSDLSWQRKGHDHGAVLGGALGATQLHLHYNTGQHISANGHELAQLLDELVRAWPVPVQRISIIGHSMGGLVARAACRDAAAADQPWLRLLRDMVFLGTPHHGAPLERVGQWVTRLISVSPYTTAFARLGKLRSAGITDLRHGSITDEDWQGQDRFAAGGDPRRPVPLPEGVACHAIAATLTSQDDPSRGHVLGDGLVTVRSALGQARRPALCLDIPAPQQLILRDTSHLDLLSSQAACAQMQRWLAVR